MMDINDANQSSQRSQLRNEGDKFKQEPASNNTPEKISEKIDSEGNADDEMTFPLHRQQNGYFEKETESYEIIENTCQSFNAFQKTIVAVDKATYPNEAFYDPASIIERYPTASASGKWLPHISESRIHDITETAERNDDIDKEATFLHNAFNDYISIKESSPTSGTSGNLLPNTLKSRIQVIAEANVKETGTIPTQASSTMESSTSGSTIIPKGEKLPPTSNAGFYKREMHYDVFKEDDDWDIYQPGFEVNDDTKSLQESRFSFERLKNENAEHFTKNNSISSADYVSCQRKTINQPFHITETNERDVREIGIIPIRASPIMESSTSGSTIIPKGEKLPPISNSGFYKREMHCDVFKEDDDWDIYEPGFVVNDNTKSLQESRFSFEGLMTINSEYLAKNESKCSVDYIPCQRVSPYIERGKRCSSNNFDNNGRTFPESTEESMLQEVQEFFLNYPLHVIPILNDQERKVCIIITPYFSDDFAMRHGLQLPTISPVLDLKVPEDPEKIRSLFAGYELIQNLGVSENGFFQYINIDKQRPVDSKFIELNPYTISELDRIQELVGADIFNMIYGQLERDENYQALFRDEELLARASLYWCAWANYLEQFGEQPTNIGDDQGHNTSDVVSEDIRSFQTNADFPSITSQSHAIKTSGLNDLDETSEDIFASRTNTAVQSTTSRSQTPRTPGLSYLDPNSCADDGKNSQYSTDLPKVQSVNPIDFLETELECSPTMQSTHNIDNHDNIKNPSSIDSFQGHSNKSNKDNEFGDSLSTNAASFMIPHIQNFFHQNDEETPREEHLVTPNNATHSSDQTFKGKSRDDQSEKSFEALPNVSKAFPRVRKYISQVDDAKSRKKIRLQENPNFGQPKSYKEESRRKEESRTPSQDSWPIKPRKKSCIVM